jgi:hypothetical protein
VPSKGRAPVISLDRVEEAFSAVMGALDKKIFLVLLKNLVTVQISNIGKVC